MIIDTEVNELLINSEQLLILKLKVELASKKILDSIQKPIYEWTKVLPIESIQHALSSHFIRTYRQVNGENYFTYTPPNEVQIDFEQFIINELNDTKKYFYDYENNIFFILKKMRFNTINSILTETFEAKDNKLNYTYNGIAYSGFSNKSVQQRLTIDLTSLKVIEYIDSTKQYDSYSTCGTRLNTDFILKLVDCS